MSGFFDYGETGAAGDPAPKLFSRLEPADWERIAEFAARRRYPAGATIVAARDGQRALFIVLSGSVAVRGATAPATIGEGGAFGMESFLSGGERAASIVAAEPVEVLMIDDEGLAQLTAWKPRVAMALVRDLAADVARRLARHETPL